MVRLIPTRVHGILDYVTGSALLAAPEIFRLKPVGRSALAPRAAGLGATTYSALTDYELGLAKLIPMRVHLALDAASGSLLAASPWLFRFHRHGVRHWLPHVLVGGSELAVALTSKTEPPARRRMNRKLILALGLSAGLAGAVATQRGRVLGAIGGRDSGETSDETGFTSVGMTSAGEPPRVEPPVETPPTPAPPAGGPEAPGATLPPPPPPPSETPGTSAPPL